MKTIMVAFSNPVDGKEDEYNEWYANVHLKEVVQVKGFKSAQRLRLADAQMMEGQAHKYLVIYEMENEDVAGTVANLQAAIGGGQLHMKPVIDEAGLTMSIFQSIAD